MPPQNPAHRDLEQLYSQLCQTLKAPKKFFSRRLVDRTKSRCWNIIHYLTTKRNEQGSHKKTKSHLECLLLSERGLSKKAIYSTYYSEFSRETESIREIDR